MACAEFGNPAARRIAVVARIVNGLSKLVHSHVRRGDVRIAETEVYDVYAGTARLQFQLVDLRKDVRGQALNPSKLHRLTIAFSLARSAFPPVRNGFFTTSTDRGQPQIAQVTPVSREFHETTGGTLGSPGKGPAQLVGPREPPREARRDRRSTNSRRACGASGL